MPLKKPFTLLFGLALILLSSSAILNILLFSQAKKYYLELNEVRLDPAGLSRYPIASDPAAIVNQTRVVFFGDSRAEGWTSPRLNDYEFINRGISSQTSEQAIQRFSPHIAPLKPNVIVIQIGINDLKTIALFPERKAEIVARCQVNIARIVEEARTLGAIVILTTIFPTGDVPIQRRPFWSDEIGQAVNETNTYIFTLAGAKVIIVNASSFLTDQNGILKKEYQVDELHLNEKGYETLNQALVQQLQILRQ